MEDGHGPDSNRRVVVGLLVLGAVLAVLGVLLGASLVTALLLLAALTIVGVGWMSANRRTRQ